MLLLAVTFGLFNLGGSEIVLILALFLILLGGKKLPELGKGMMEGMFKFRDAVDDESAEAGRNLGGIYGKAATQALTHDNRVAELYDPAVFEKDSQPRGRRNRLMKLLSAIWRWVARVSRLHVLTF